MRTGYWPAYVTRKNPPTNNSPHKISLCEAKKCSVYTEHRIEKILCCETSLTLVSQQKKQWRNL